MVERNITPSMQFRYPVYTSSIFSGFLVVIYLANYVMDLVLHVSVFYLRESISVSVFLTAKFFSIRSYPKNKLNWILCCNLNLYIRCQNELNGRVWSSKQYQLWETTTLSNISVQRFYLFLKTCQKVIWVNLCLQTPLPVLELLIYT